MVCQFTAYVRLYCIYLVCCDSFVVVHPRVKLPSAEFPPPTSRDGTSSNAAEWSTCNLVYGVSEGQRLMDNYHIKNGVLYSNNVRPLSTLLRWSRTHRIFDVRVVLWTCQWMELSFLPGSSCTTILDTCMNTHTIKSRRTRVGQDGWKRERKSTNIQLKNTDKHDDVWGHRAPSLKSCSRGI